MTSLALEDLRPRVRRRADMVESQFVTDEEISDYLQSANRELYYFLVGKYEDLFVSRQDTDSSAPTLLEPTEGLMSDGGESQGGFFKLKALFLIDGSDYLPLSRISDIEAYRRFRVARASRPTHYSLSTRQWGRPFGDGYAKVQLYPEPDQTYTLRYFYIPTCDPLSEDDASRVYSPYITALDEFLIIAAAIKCKDKEESDCTVLMAEKEQILQRMEAALQPGMDAAEPARVQQLEYRRYLDPSDPEAMEDVF